MLNIVVARRGEEVRWIDDLPEHCTVTVYTDDASLGTPLDVTRPLDLVRLPGEHQVSEMYLAHLARRVHGHPDSHTVFSPGDPLAVCPDFLAMLENTALWNDVQPLSQATGAPPASEPPRDWLAGLPVSPVRFDLRSWAPLGGFDKTLYRVQQRYRQAWQLPADHHPAAHFLQACHLHDLAQAVRQHDLGMRDGGLLFAVRQTRLDQWQSTHAQTLPQVTDWLRRDPVHVRIWDQFWLHLFGLPFVRLDALAAAEPVPDEEEVWIEEDFSLSRALATIDDTLARLAPPPLSRQSNRPSALQIARAAALRDRHADRTPLARAPQEPDSESKALAELSELSERAAQAFRAGDFQYAVSCARLALQQAEQHTASRFTLAMALAALGQREAALEQFERLLPSGVTAPDRLRVPDRTPSTTRPQ